MDEQQCVFYCCKMRHITCIAGSNVNYRQCKDMKEMEKLSLPLTDFTANKL